MGADDRSDLDTKTARSRTSRDRARRGAPRRREPGCAGPPSRRRRRRPRLPGSRPCARMRGPRCGRARSGVISASSVRIGLIFSGVPSYAWAAPMRPPRRRNSSVSTQNQTSGARRASWALAVTARGRRRASPRPRRRARRARARRTRSPRPRPRSRLRRPARPASAACRADSQVPEMPPERWIETMSFHPRPGARRPRGSRRSTAARWSAARRRCAGTRSRRRSRAGRLAVLAALPVDVQD